MGRIICKEMSEMPLNSNNVNNNNDDDDEDNVNTEDNINNDSISKTNTKHRTKSRIESKSITVRDHQFWEGWMSLVLGPELLVDPGQAGHLLELLDGSFGDLGAAVEIDLVEVLEVLCDLSHAGVSHLAALTNVEGLE